MRRGLAGSVCLLVASFASGACTADECPLEWTVSYADPMLEDAVHALEATVSRGGCDETGRLVASLDLGPGAMPARPLRLPPGRYALRMTGRDATCAVIAQGCSALELPACDREAVQVELLPQAPGPCEGECRAGRCVLADAGPIDAGPADAGAFDVGPAVDAGADAGPVDAGPCGAPGESCCEGTTCESGACCDRGVRRCVADGETCPSRGACRAGYCIPCGVPGEPCCGGAMCLGAGCCVGGTCAASGGSAGTGMVCWAGAVEACGMRGQHCCQDNECAGGCCANGTCVNDGESCGEAGTCMTGVCTNMSVTCGTMSERCCSEGSVSYCSAPRTLCESGAVCVACGEALPTTMPPQRCCRGQSCRNGGCCIGSVCFAAGSECPDPRLTCMDGGCRGGDPVRFCGRVGEPCCDGVCSGPWTQCGPDAICAMCGGLGQECCLPRAECAPPFVCSGRVCRAA